MQLQHTHVEYKHDHYTKLTYPPDKYLMQLSHMTE